METAAPDGPRPEDRSAVPDAFPTTSLLVTLLAAAMGALGWGLVAHFTGYEIGYAAWAIGALVGYAAVRSGARGTTAAIAAAGLTVLSILGGKLLASQLIFQRSLESLPSYCSPELHEEISRDAEDFARLPADPDEQELRRFLVDHGYSEADHPSRVSEYELAGFREVTVPTLVAWKEEQPSYDEWLASNRELALADFSVVGASLEGLGPIDAIFFLLAVSTAFGLVRRESTAA